MAQWPLFMAQWPLFRALVYGLILSIRTHAEQVLQNPPKHFDDPGSRQVSQNYHLKFTFHKENFAGYHPQTQFQYFRQLKRTSILLY